MNNFRRNAILFIFLFVIVVSLDGLQSSDAGIAGNGNTVPLHPVVKVKFDSITIHHDHDGPGVRPWVCCSGEWTLAAIVQGKGIDLMYERGHIDDGDTINFPTDAEVSVEMLSESLPLSIMTIGGEDDSGGVYFLLFVFPQTLLVLVHELFKSLMVPYQLGVTLSTNINQRLSNVMFN